MSSLDDDCIEEGICAEVLPQYFELADGSVRVRSGAQPGNERTRDQPDGRSGDMNANSVPGF